VAVGLDQTFANSSNSIKYSFNGVTWSNASNAFANYGFGIAWNGFMWVASGLDSSSSNSLKYSYNGINWSNGTGGFTAGQFAYSVAWNGRMWVAQGGSATVKYSFNGINWSNGTGAFAEQGLAVAFSSNVYADFQIENLSFFGKGLFNTVYSTNSIHIQTSSILINNSLRVNQPNLITQSLSNPTVDIIGSTRVQSLLVQSNLGIRNPNPSTVLDIQLPSTSGVFSNYPIVRGNVSSETDRYGQRTQYSNASHWGRAVTRVHLRWNSNLFV
jgi:hypothetical protein